MKKEANKERLTDGCMARNEGTHAILTQPPVYNIDYVFRLLRYRLLVYNIGVEEPDVMEVLLWANLNF